MSNPFELSKHIKVQTSEIEGSRIYEVRNVFARPYDAIDYIMSQPAPFNKASQRGVNGIKFEDRRHVFEADVNQLEKLCVSVCEQRHTHPSKVLTNYTKLNDDPFNDYQNNYWWPHLDHGYNGLVYLNDYIGTGTNLFHPVLPRKPRHDEHVQPWNPKDQWTLVHTVRAEFNKLVLFDGAKFYHSMAIDDKTWFKRHRLNIVMFFAPS